MKLGDSKMGDFNNKRFGRWLVLEDFIMVKRNVYCRCVCDCGVIKTVRKSSLYCGDSVSCGCFNKEVISITNSKHRLSDHPLYDTWALMIRRCHDVRHKNFSTYGGRGIFVCMRWMFSVKNFIDDMDNKPSKDYSLDRIDNKKGYSKQNCKWSTQTEQCRNKRSNRIVEFNGKKQCLSSWCEELNIPYHRTKDRLHKFGWSTEDAFNIPKQKTGSLC